MPYTVSKYPHGTFCWADAFSTDIEATKKFLTGLFGWTSKDMPTGQENMDYTQFFMDGKVVAGASPFPAMMKGMPSFWSNYVNVDNVDEVVAKVEELGGKVTMPAMDVLDQGRMAGIQDPTGANVNIWQAKNHIGAQLVNTIGAMGWNELYTKDLETAKKFYTELFGWSFESSPDMPDYVIIKNNGRMNGGAMEITKEMEGMPPNWTVYFTVANIEESLKKVKELGGVVHMGPQKVSVGQFAMISDPAGAGFIIMESAVKPDEWAE